MAYLSPILAGVVVITGVMVIAVILFTLGLSWIHDSKIMGFKQALALVPIFLSWIFSTVARLVRIVGWIFRFTSLYRVIFSIYPGSEFAAERREDFISRGVEYIDRGVVEVDRDSNELAREIRRIYDESGTQLSDGEAFFGFSLAIVGYFSLGPELLTTSLSVALALAVALRISALDSVMYVDPDSNESPKRLKVMLGWNRAMSNGAKILFTLGIFRFLMSVDARLYEIYLDRTFAASVAGDGLDRRDLPAELWRPFQAILRGRMKEMDPEKMSMELYDENVFRIPSGSKSQADETA
jgi:hypothetical protein